MSQAVHIPTAPTDLALQDPCPDKLIIPWQKPTRRFLRLWLNRVKKYERCDLTLSDLEPGVSYVFASNHQSRLDPLLINVAMSDETWHKLMPIRVMTARGLFWVPVLNFIMLRLGCFPSRKHYRFKYGLQYATTLLEHGKPMMIFPEGRRTIRGESRTRRGVEVLAHLPNVKVIPSHVEWTGSVYRKRTLSIVVGKPFDGSKMTAQEILDRIYSLPVDGK